MNDPLYRRTAETTCWTLISLAAQGGALEREAFVSRYTSVIHAYLSARWKNSPIQSDIDDACQEVFIECFRSDGPLAKADPNRRFRTYLYGVVRNIARRAEQNRGRHPEKQPTTESHFDKIESSEESLGRVFDRAWALQILKETAETQTEKARSAGQDAIRRVELLRMRFEKELPVREIARTWNIEPESLHRELSKAKKEFGKLLRETVSQRHDSATEAEIDAECREIVSLVSTK